MSDIDARGHHLKSVFDATSPKLFDAELTEADVRAKLIDPLFISGLAWPEDLVRREATTATGEELDYRFGAPTAHFVLEAKRASFVWQLPQQSIRNTFQIDGLIRQDKELKKAIIQVARYCQDTNCPFAALTNGMQLLVFRALRTDRPWMKGEALVFRSQAELVGRFSEIWDLLSLPATASGSLFRFFSFPDETPREFRSVISSIQNPDEKLIRNRLASPLIPILKTVLGDLTEDQQQEVLTECYVYSSTLKNTADNFVLAIKDLPPEYLAGQIEQLRPERHTGGGLQAAIQKIASEAKRGEVLLLLGGIGAGKTTFLRQVQVKYCADAIRDHGIFLNIDFRGAPEQPPFERYVFAGLRRQLDKSPTFIALSEKEFGYKSATTVSPPLSSIGALLKLFELEMAQEAENARAVGITNPKSVANSKLRLVERVKQDDHEVVVRAFRALEASGRFVLLAFDNADQLQLEYQLQIFLLAQNIAFETGANIIVALREEKYYLASQQGAFSAYHTSKFHIPSPKLRELLFLRLRYALRHLDTLLADHSVDIRRDVADFLDAILRGGVGVLGNQNVVRLLERTCHGNMRSALKMFQLFLQSGNTDVEKILDIYRRNKLAQRGTDFYHVPFHEFTKSVMLGEYRYFQETNGELIANVFGISGRAPDSHFTALRLLRYLMGARDRPSSQGRGYVDITEYYATISSVFGDIADTVHHVKKLLKSGLIESNTGVSDTGSDRYRAIRVLPAGEYYLNYLSRAFAYLDLCWVDTPISDTGVHTQLLALLDRKDKDARFTRVDIYMNYLSAEEAREFRDFPGIAAIQSWREPLMPEIREQIEREKIVISQNFAKYERRS